MPDYMATLFAPSVMQKQAKSSLFSWYPQLFHMVKGAMFSDNFQKNGWTSIATFQNMIETPVTIFKKLVEELVNGLVNWFFKGFG